MNQPIFAKQWLDHSDASFRAYAAAAIDIGRVASLDLEERNAFYRNSCTTERRTFLSRISGCPVSKRLIKWLPRTDWQSFTEQDWQTLISLSHHRNGASLGHVHRITPTLLRQFLLVPNLLRETGLFNVLASLHVPTSRWKHLGRQLAQLRVADHSEVINSARRIKLPGDFWDLYFRIDGQYDRKFYLPTESCKSEIFELLESAADMKAEGSRMRNCLGNRCSLARSGDRIFFKGRGDLRVSAELIRSDRSWSPGEIMGPGNQVVEPELEKQLRAELARMAVQIHQGKWAPGSDTTAAFLKSFRKDARRTFDTDTLDTVHSALSSIRGRSLTWTDSAYAIFDIADRGFVQAMSSPGGAEYLLEISSHRFQDCVSRRMRSRFVKVIEAGGFEWPIEKANFSRWFAIGGEIDLEQVSELVLALLGSLFGAKRGLSAPKITVHLPEDALIRSAGQRTFA